MPTSDPSLTRLRYPTRPPSTAVELAIWFWLIYVIVSVSSSLIFMVYTIPQSRWHTYMDRDLGLGTAWLVPMSAAGAIAFGCAVAVGNRFARGRGVRPVGTLWFATASALAAIALALTGVPTVIGRASDWLLGPASMWGLATLPAGLAVLGAAIAAAGVALIRRRAAHRNASAAAA